MPNSIGHQMESISTDEKHPLTTVHRRWAIYALQQLALHDLSLKPSLFENGPRFLIAIGDVGARLNDIAAHFDNNIRPVTANISVVESAPAGFNPVEVATTLQEDMWSSYNPLSVSHMNQMLALISDQVPKGGIDYSHETNRWQFKHFGIDDASRQAVQRACTTLGITSDIEFVESELPTSSVQTQHVSHSHVAGDALEIGTRYLVSSVNPKLRRLVECDEDTWRTFVGTRGTSVQDERSLFTPRRFACLYDARDESPVQLAELLTMYDVVHVLPTDDLAWLQRHRLSLSDLSTMTALGRVKLVLPMTVKRYPESLVLAATEQSDDGVVLSRNLATKVVKNGERKDPLMYGPFTTEQRTAVLRQLHQNATQDVMKLLVSTYASSHAQHGLAYAIRGANAAYGIGFGAFLGQVLYHLQGVDARLEMMTTGASMEWAMGLGAAYVPRQLGKFDETHNASLIASYISRSRQIPRKPLGNRMHTVVNELLALTDVPPIEIAKNFRSNTVSQFRQVAMGLISSSASTDELRDAVAKINSEVRAFEHRRQFLIKWKVDAILVSGATKLMMDPLDAQFGSWTSWFASVAANFLYNMLKDNRTVLATSEVSREILDTFLGLTLAPSHDAVIMRRARMRLQK